MPVIHLPPDWQQVVAKILADPRRASEILPGYSDAEIDGLSYILRLERQRRAMQVRKPAGRGLRRGGS